MTELHVLRVFTDPAGRHGNPLGVFLDGGAMPAPAERQRVATELGFSETVFVDDPARGAIRIFTPGTELEFAGHPTVGCAWLLRAIGAPVEVLRPPAGEVRVRYDGALTAVTARPEWAPAFNHHELASPEEVDALDGPPGGDEVGAAWAWEDEAAGRVRSRVFAIAYGIFEDEATGAAAVRLAALLGRPIEIRQGRGSLVAARPIGDGYVEVAGRAVLDEVRRYEPAGGDTSSK
ncbi:MAG TPA: PhzF family phenazine biosynthesis protein [Thermoleophilaceae bacterium]